MLDLLDEVEVRAEELCLTAMDETRVGYKWQCELLTLTLEKVMGTGNTPHEALSDALQDVSNVGHALPPTDSY